MKPSIFKLSLIGEVGVLLTKLIFGKEEDYKFTYPTELVYKNWKSFFPFVGIRNDLIERRFEQEFGQAVGCNNMLAFASGRMALYVALTFIKKKTYQKKSSSPAKGNLCRSCKFDNKSRAYSNLFRKYSQF